MRDGKHVLPAMVVFVVLLAGRVPAGGSEPARWARKTTAKRPSEITAQQEKEVVRFVRLHHAELGELIEHLRSSSPADYHKAIRDLGKAQERLRQIKGRDRERYELELDAWVVRSKIQLLVARLAIKDDDALREELRSLLGQQVDIKLRLLERERERLAKRQRTLDEQMERYTTGRAAMIEKQFALLTASSKRLKRERLQRTTKRKPRPSKPSTRADGP